jgi:hypothetical protein
MLAYLINKRRMKDLQFLYLMYNRQHFAHVKGKLNLNIWSIRKKVEKT